ncbi:MAG: hypothetical protein ACQEXV_16575 [Bacillota bacterium]
MSARLHLLKNILEQVADVSMSQADQTASAAQQTAGMTEDVSASRQAPIFKRE